jgi:tetratricopeptide (TPR) repeat protein
VSISSSALSVACALCGADCEAEARFCPHCGSPISTSSKGEDALTGVEMGDGWRLTERIGVDALARLFRAERGDESHTVRVLHDHLVRNRKFAKGFAQAASDAAQLSHPGILRIVGSGTAEVEGRQYPFVLSESFEGRNLCAIIQARGLLPVSQLLLIAIEVLEALDGAHRQGIVHGDLLPEDIIIGATEDGEVRAKVANFVLGRLASIAAPRVVVGGSASGTSLYQAPELIRGEEPSLRSDIYSFGAILYEQLVGKPPFESSSCIVTERQHLQRAPKAPQDAVPGRGIGPATQQVVLRALEKEPAGRFSSASEMLRALKEAKDADVDVTPSAASAAPVRLVGRVDVLDALHATASAPVAYGKEDRGYPRGAVALVSGGAGMGKTAVLRSVQARLEGGPVSVIRVDGRRALTRPLEPFTSLARDALGLRRGAPEAVVKAVEEILATRHGMESDEIVRLIDRVTDRPSSLGLTPDVVEREQVRSLRSFIGRLVASRPTVLFVEDADAMDSASMQLTRDLMEASATLALSVIVSSRGKLWPDWDAGYVTRLQVANLEPSAARTMLKRRLAGQVVSDDVKALAVGWSRGSPLLLELCARAMSRREMLVDRDGKFKAPSTSQDLFGGLRQLVSLSLRGASPSARRWLSCAALAGVSATIEMLESFERPRPNRDAVIDACFDTGLVRSVDESLVFDNEGVREVVRAMVPESESRQIHMFIASWLREVDPTRAPLEVIAQHMFDGGDQLSAAELFEADARDLARRDEALAASALLGRAERIWLEAGDEAAMRRSGLARAEALLAAGDGKAAADLMANLERFGPLSADGLRARVFAAVATAQGNRDLALQSLQRASDIAVDTLDQDAWFEVEFALAESLYKQGRGAEAEGHAAMALELSTSIADSRGEDASLIEGSRIAQAATFLSKLRIELGRPDEARDALTLSLKHTAVLGDQASASRLLANLAYACAETNEPEASLEYARRAFELASRAGDRMAASRIAINLGAYLAKLGKTEEALQAFSRAKALARAVGWARGVRLSKSASARLRAGKG